ncbi:hypothetical protein [Streptomyces tsukubensis]|uniref:Uncharacterized protein n=1 Tax=Streptomyces tsukubensis TaxID=83656 RepID=A0A1V4A3M6_9ACTN|nr:hypothetical protein [Streptomyces tsukubensis]OON73982.1 hypothetical protein B1H18_26025 [Streptomyces tsukubensis]QFR92972.1 hypothetical protein GBW32_07680 [Streptomyces tsukubensis]
MEHEMRAEYPEGVSVEDPDAEIKLWHMVRLEGSTAMCGRQLDAAAPVQSADAWGTPAADPFCHTCGALYLREVP